MLDSLYCFLAGLAQQWRQKNKIPVSARMTIKSYYCWEFTVDYWLQSIDWVCRTIGGCSSILCCRRVSIVDLRTSVWRWARISISQEDRNKTVTHLQWAESAIQLLTDWSSENSSGCCGTSKRDTVKCVLIIFIVFGCMRRSEKWLLCRVCKSLNRD